MKHIRLIAAAFIIAALVTGCGKKQEPPKPSPQIILPKPVDDPTPTPSAAAPTQSAVQSAPMFFEAPATKPADTYIVVLKGEKVLELYGDGSLIGRFSIRLGENSKGHKEKEGDKKTPEGEYFICTRKGPGETENTLFMGINYPNGADAKAALDAGVIKQDIYERIERAERNKERPTWSSPLGGAIGIHGKYDDRQFTQGCIAVTDEAVQIIWDYTKMGTKVTIKP